MPHNVQKRTLRQFLKTHHGKPKSMVIIGKATRTKLVDVAKKKNSELFISRLEFITTVDGVQECEVEIFVHDDSIRIFSFQVKCTRQKTKFNTYASF